jgi:hypothetical protein
VCSRDVSMPPPAWNTRNRNLTLPPSCFLSLSP